MRNKMIREYRENRDFRRYVDACMDTYHKTFDEVLQLRITESYFNSLQKGGCNERREHEQNN